MGSLDPSPVAHWIHPQWYTHMYLFWYRNKSPGALGCSFCGPHTQFHVHITVPGGRCFSGLQLALLPPQSSASTSAKAGMKEAFQRKQADPVTADKRLQ